MTNLPITNSSPQTAAVSKQSANAADSSNTLNSQPFGEVLARQISDPAAKDTKASDKLAIDALVQPGADANSGKKEITSDKKTDIVATDGTTTLPADMLAALLPQAMNTSTATSTNAPGTNSANITIDGNASTTADLGKRVIASLKTNVPSTLPASVAPKAATTATAETPTMEKSFATALGGSASRTTPGTELNSAVREALTVVAQQPNSAPQSNSAAIASLQNTAATIAAPFMQPVQLTINTPVNQDKWADEFNQKITWLASSSQDHTAELHLNPPHLGPLDVVLKISGDQATALFTSPHAAVRDAVEQAMPRLRDMLADNGIMLGNATVSDQTPRDQGQSGAQRTVSAVANSLQDSPALSSGAAKVSPISRHNGIVDTFA
jgi:flagellar hook-length control protein FliK